MAKKTQVKEKVEYLYGTFNGNGIISIDANTPAKEVEAFLKDNPLLKKRITDKERIEAQRKLMRNG